MSENKNPYENKYFESENVIELEGKDFKIKDEKVHIINKLFKNKYGLVKFYAPWCGHCSRMVTDINFLANGLSSHNFKVAAVNVTNPTNKEVGQFLGISGIPALFNINSDGEIVKLSEEFANDRSIEGLLNNICNFTNKDTCCKRDDEGNINC